MGMSTHVVGFKPPNEKWRKMKSIYDACEEAGVTAPDEVYDFFEDCKPDPAGVQVDLKKVVKPWHDECSDGFEIDLKALPKDVTVIRFFNSW